MLPASPRASYFELLSECARARLAPGRAGAGAHARCRPRARFDLDLREVRQRYLELQQALHPDRFATRDAQEQARAQAASSLINRAYNTLKDPLSRAVYLVRASPLPRARARAAAARPDARRRALAGRSASCR